MKRRQAIIAAIGAMVGIMSGKAKSEPFVTDTLKQSGVSFNLPPQSVAFSFDSYEKFTFTWKDKSITLTGEEMFAALNEK